MTENTEWKRICERFCKMNGYQLLFVNDADFGFYDTKNDRLVHWTYKELLGALGNG